MLLPHLRFAERDPLWRREMRERWRRPVTLFFLVLYVVGLCWFAYSLYGALVPAGVVEQGNQARGIGHKLFVSLLGVQIAGWIPIAVLLAAPTIAAERERFAFTEYLLAGLSARQIARAKFVSIATFIVVMCAVPLPILALCFPMGGVEPMELVAGALLEMAVALVCASVGLLISALHSRVTSAMQHGLVVALVLFLGVGLLLPGLLEVHFGVWLIVAAFSVFVMFLVLIGCEQSLEQISQHLERHERERRPVAPPPPLPTPQPRPQAVRVPTNWAAADEVTVESSWDMWVEKVAGWNAITQREVRVGLRASRIRMALSPDQPTFQLSPWVWLLIGLCGAVFVWATSSGSMWMLSLGLFMAGLLFATALGSSAVFTNEREQKMFTQLQLSPLSPLEVVTGKIAAILLLVVRSWGGALLALVVMGLSQGTSVALTSALFVVLSVLLAATVGTLLSLLCRHTAIALGGTVGTLAVMFVLLPLAPMGLLYFAPSLRAIFESPVLGSMWIEPLTIVQGAMSSTSATASVPPSPPVPIPTPAPASLEEALMRLICSLLIMNTLLIVAATGTLARTRLDDTTTGTGFWDRDLSRSLR